MMSVKVYQQARHVAISMKLLDLLCDRSRGQVRTL